MPHRLRTIFLSINIVIAIVGCSTKRQSAGPQAAATTDASVQAKTLDITDGMVPSPVLLLDGSGESAGANDAGGVQDQAADSKSLFGPAPLPEGFTQLFECVESQAKMAGDASATRVLLLELAALQAQVDVNLARRTIDEAAPTLAEEAPLLNAVLAIGSRDIEVAQRVIRGLMLEELRRTCLTGITNQLAALTPLKAQDMALLIEPRIAREHLLLSIIERVREGTHEGAILLTDRVIEPLLNDYAMALVAEALSVADPEAAAGQLGSIESDLIKKWALLPIAVEAAAQETPSSAVLARQISVGYSRDEFYAQLAIRLAVSEPDRALTTALRIDDEHLKKLALKQVSRALFAARPGLALGILQEDFSDREVLGVAQGLLEQSCREEPERFAAILKQVKRKVPAAELTDSLLHCCIHAPAAAAEALAEHSTGTRDQIRYCRVCGGTAPEPIVSARHIGDPRLKDEAYACVVRRTSDQLVAGKALAGIGDSVLADEVRLELVDALLAEGRADVSEGLAEEIKDPYLAARAALAIGTADPGRLEGALKLLQVNLGDMSDTWRRDDLLTRAVVAQTGNDWLAAFKLATAIADGKLRKAALLTVTSGVPESKLAASSSATEHLDDHRLRARWCLALAARALAYSGGDSSQPDSGGQP